MHKFADEPRAIALLSDMAARLQHLEQSPLFLSESPNKFNDAGQDDLWLAVQSGETYWEQSHFFEDRSEPLVREHSAYGHNLSGDSVLDIGASFESSLIASLRRQLKELQDKEWRKLIRYDHLIGLAYEMGQWWLVLELVNYGEGEVYSWDDDGFFLVGIVDRIDDRVGQKRLFYFETVDTANLARLGSTARAYFEPNLVDLPVATDLHALLVDAIATVRKQSPKPAGLKSSSSPPQTGVTSRFYSDFPRSFHEDLREKEGEFRRPDQQGRWPKYQPRPSIEPQEYSDLAKTLHTTLGTLEQAGWRAIFGQALGEKLDKNEAVSLFLDSEIAVVTRDNSAFLVEEDRLSFLGQIPFPNCHDLPDIFANLRALLD
ncbi:MAG: hypothetical protein OXD48_11640 [Litoreibacter sp.]|nr:hypothetical protein [Litoreibacter sp.]